MTRWLSLAFLFLVTIHVPLNAQFVQQGLKLVPSNATTPSSVGTSCAASSDGNTVIVGGPEANTFGGAAWVFVRAGTRWTQQATLVGLDSVGEASQGRSVAISADGNTAVIGGDNDDFGVGAAWVFIRNGAAWVQQGPKVVGTGASGVANQGSSVAISADGNTIIVGGESDSSETGAAWVFTRSAGVWSQQGSKLVGTGSVGLTTQGESVALSSDGNTAIVGGSLDSSASGAAWVFTRSNGIWTQEAPKLTGTGAAGKARVGYSVYLAADGNTALAGGPADSSGLGAAWVFERRNGSWEQVGKKLVGKGGLGTPEQGIAVALSADGSTALVGGAHDNTERGAGWLFARSGNAWNQIGEKLTGTGASGSSVQEGTSVFLSADGNTAFIGGPGDVSGRGAFWVFARAPWTQQGGKITGGDATSNAEQGNAVALTSDASTAIVGGRGDNNSVGAGWIYTRQNNVWLQQGFKLTGTGNVGQSQQGSSVAISDDGNTAIMGGPFDNGSAGAAWVFTRNGVTWSQQGGKLVGSDTIGHAALGTSVALSADGNTALIGGSDDHNSVGAAWVFTRTGGTWSQEGSKLVGTGASGPANLGSAVSLSADGNTALVGGVSDSAFVGAAWVFTRSAGVWTQQGPKLTASDEIGHAFFGNAVSLSSDGNTAMIGGPMDRSNHGAAWIFTRSGNVWTQQGLKLIGNDSIGTAQQGFSVALSKDGNTAVEGGPFDGNDVGAAWIFTRNGNTWTQQGKKLVGAGVAGGSSEQGFSVATSANGSYALVGGVSDSSARGAAWFYTLQSTLPTMLSSFAVGPNPHGPGVLINWVTTNEVAIAGFEVQRSAENESGYTTLPNGFVQGHGNSAAEHAYTFSDSTVGLGLWYYRLKEIHQDSSFQFSEGVSTNVITGLEESGSPYRFALEQNYPNPFNPTTGIRFQVSGVSQVKLVVYDLIGRQVAVLVNEAVQPGVHIVRFDGSRLASGVYFYRLSTPAASLTRKMIMLK